MNEFAAEIRNACAEAVLAEHERADGCMLEVKADDIRRIVETLKKCRHETMLLTDISAVNIEEGTRIFDVYYRIFFIDRSSRLTLKCRVGDEEIDSVADIMPAAMMPEREVCDMFGLRFRGHAEMPRLFMHCDFEGHPLLRDYPLLKRQILLERTKFE